MVEWKCLMVGLADDDVLRFCGGDCVKLIE